MFLINILFSCALERIMNLKGRVNFAIYSYLMLPTVRIPL